MNVYVISAIHNSFPAGKMNSTDQYPPPGVRATSILDPLGGVAGYYESHNPDGSLRDHWQPLATALDAIGSDHLGHRQQRANGMRHEDGATFNPFEISGERASVWPLDILPLPITARDWQLIESAVIQRANLLEQVLADVYGPQQLVKNRHIPAELLYANPNFLRPCHAISPKGNRFLSFYAVDLYRNLDGTFGVLRDYGRHPPGLGYALENRIVISRVFPDLYQKTQILRLAPFFHALHRTIYERNVRGHHEPDIVLLTPGPDSPTYFEHAFLSRYLGFPLVEGQDLSFRDGRIFLKKLAGLEPVEAILRYIDDNESDQFAFRRRRIDGVTGMVQAAYEGQVDIVNPLGSSFIDTPLLAGYLPQLCRLLRGEELLVAERDLLWFGHGGRPNAPLPELGGKVIEAALNRSATLPPPEKLEEALRLTPYNFMAREPVTFSLSPAWNHGAVSQQPTLLRVFACATAEGFTVMPGGLAITASDPTALLGADWERQQSKDIWVLSTQPVEPFSMMEGLQATSEFNRSSDLPSRVADNLLWLGRYLERAEGRLRLLRSIFRRLASEATPRDIPEFPFLLQLLDATFPLPDKKGSHTAITPAEVLMDRLTGILFASDNPDSVIVILQRIQETARNVRDRLSLDCWRVINRLEEFLTRPDDPLDLLEDALFNLSAFSGLAMESMTRGFGWRFMDMGRRLERAMFQTTILQAGLPAVCGHYREGLETLLEVGDSAMTYRARYRTTLQFAPVLDLLIADESNPKSLAFQCAQLAWHVKYLPRRSERRYSSLEERLALEMLTSSRLLNLYNTGCENESLQPLSNFLDTMEQLLVDFAQQIVAHYLSRVPATPHFANSSTMGEDR
ncbi:MAG: circularly permuted type 2 ATP-grasp protein [Desulfopila sp.]